MVIFLIIILTLLIKHFRLRTPAQATHYPSTLN